MQILDIATTKNYEVEGIVLNKKTVEEIYEKFFKENIENLIDKKDNGFIIPYININGEKAKNYSKEKLVNFFKKNGFFEIHYLFSGENFEVSYTSNSYLCQLNDIFIKDPFLESLNLEGGYQNHFKGYPIKLSEEYDYPEKKEFSEDYIFSEGKYYRNKDIVKYLEVLNKNISEILERDHYGLKDAKEKVLDYLAVKKLNPSMNGVILCLAGPPGIGKTSLVKSIAESMGRKFVRVSLGGVRDEAEIRGHRRTYVGSMPGKIMKAMKEAGTNNPVMLLDEIDKMSNDFKGDPASAMLEVLDPEQNKNFEDHYIDYPFDLSKVFFICTANDLGGIPGPLRDRMEIIYIESYTEFEKLNIAKRYLIPQTQEENGLKNYKIPFTDDSILKIINEYTREAGVRNLRREIGKLFRKMAREALTAKSKKLSVTEAKIKKYLGNPKYREDKIKEKAGKVGVVNGLAWTAVGGTMLEVQAVKMEGKGHLQLTGKLGSVMQESAKVAYSYVRHIKNELGIKDKFNEKTDIHLHFPEGAVPKDGPSAGITITTAIISVLTNKEVRQDVAMTGEITITGEVLAIGGVKEKVIAAHRVGIRDVVLPMDNKIDTEELPEEITKEMKFHFAETYDDVKKIVFVEKTAKKTEKTVKKQAAKTKTKKATKK